MNIQNKDFTNFVKDIKQKILVSQYEALKAVNKELINLYWDIGKNIVLKQEAFGWGKSVVKNLYDELRKKFAGIRGFSVQNLWNMRLFYLEYCQNEKLQPLVGEIGWSYNVAIFQKSKDSHKPIGISTYKLTESLPKNLKGFLPSSEEIEEKLLGLIDE